MNNLAFPLLGILAVLVLIAGMVDDEGAQDLPRLSREEIMETASWMAEHRWVVKEENLYAPCLEGSVPAYESDFQANDTVTGLPYDWGGWDDPETFEERMAAGDAAGSHRLHGLEGSECTRGVDCSGFVSLSWTSTKKHGTSTIHEISSRLHLDWFTELLPGDALNKPGSHIVLFAGYAPDGRPIVYEASGAAHRVILNDWSKWSRFQDYYPIRYRNVED